MYLVEMCRAGDAASTIVATAVVISTSASVASSIGSAAGAAAAAAATTTTTTPGSPSLLQGVVPIVMGAQRLAVSAGLAANVSAAYRSSLSALDWSLGVVQGTISSCHEEPTPPSPPPAVPPPASSPPPGDDEVVTVTVHTDIVTWLFGTSCESLARLWCVLLGFVAAALCLQGMAHLLWKRRVNRLWYRLRLPLERFIPYPSAMVFPNLLLAFASIPLTAMVTNAVTVLSGNEATSCDRFICSCAVLAWMALAFALMFILLSIRLVARFNRVARVATWRATVPVDCPSMVRDPLFRALSKLRARTCASTNKHAVVERMRGVFECVPAEIQEPARTERLLRNPCTHLRANASDTLDAYHHSFLLRAGGSSAIGTSLEVSLLTAQLLIGSMNGLGPGLDLQPGSPGAVAQLWVIVALQVTTCAWVVIATRTSDRLETLTLSLQFTLEAVQTALLLVFTAVANPALERASFGCALAALFMPVVKLLYDSLALVVAKCCSKDTSVKDVCAEVAQLICALPKLVLQLLGITFGATDFATHAGDDMVKMGVKAQGASSSIFLFSSRRSSSRSSLASERSKSRVQVSSIRAIISETPEEEPEHSVVYPSRALDKFSSPIVSERPEEEPARSGVYRSVALEKPPSPIVSESPEEEPAHYVVYPSIDLEKRASLAVIPDGLPPEEKTRPSLGKIPPGLPPRDYAVCSAARPPRQPRPGFKWLKDVYAMTQASSDV